MGAGSCARHLASQSRADCAKRCAEGRETRARRRSQRPMSMLGAAASVDVQRTVLCAGLEVCKVGSLGLDAGGLLFFLT